MTATIHIGKLMLHARHGVMAQEQVVGAWYRVDLKATVCCQPQSDDLAGTVDYSALVRAIREEMEQPSRLLEHLVHRTGTALLCKFPSVESLTLAVFKQNPPLGIKCEEVGVEMHFHR